MSLTEHKRYVRISINGTPVQFVDYSISESIDNLCTVAEFTLAEMPQPEPFAGDADADADDILIEWVDIDADLVYAVFGGKISTIDVESDPWQLVIRCVDQLELTRKIRNGSDLDLTGMTEGEAVEALLTYCGVDFDSADISDSGYVLGERLDVKWLKDGTTTAAQVIAEFNRVFRQSLFTIGNNRVIRIPYDPTPDDEAGLYATYTKAVNIDFQAHHRTHGDRDRVQNVWVVRGPSVESNDGSCSRTVWARAEDGGLLVGSSRRARVPPQEFQSDLIQDEELAEQIVRSLMQQTNRLPDEGTATLELDPNVHQCSKIAIIDATYGIGANPRYFLVRAVTRSGVTMVLDLTAGPPGEDGTVTHGVDKVCTDVHTSDDWPGDFEWPAFDYPPIDDGVEIPDYVYPGFFGDPLRLGSVGGIPETFADPWSCGTELLATAALWTVTDGSIDDEV